MRKSVVVLVISFVLMLGSLGAAFVVNAAWVNEETTLSKELSGLKSEMELNRTSQELSKSKSSESSADIDAARVEKEEKEALSLIKEMSTWSNYDEYVSVRKVLAEEYFLTPDSWVLTVFLPEVKASTSSAPNSIEANKISMAFKDADIVCIGREGSTYRYLARVVTTDGRNGESTDTVRLFTFSVETDGTFSDFSGIAMST